MPEKEKLFPQFSSIVAIRLEYFNVFLTQPKDLFTVLEYREEMEINYSYELPFLLFQLFFAKSDFHTFERIKVFNFQFFEKLRHANKIQSGQQ